MEAASVINQSVNLFRHTDVSERPDDRANSLATRIISAEQYRMKVGAIDVAALDPFKKQAHGHGRENEKSLLYLFWL